MFITVDCVLFLIRLRHGFRQINFPYELLFWVKIRIFSLSIFRLKSWLKDDVWRCLRVVRPRRLSLKGTVSRYYACTKIIRFQSWKNAKTVGRGKKTHSIARILHIWTWCSLQWCSHFFAALQIIFSLACVSIETHKLSPSPVNIGVSGPLTKKIRKTCVTPLLLQIWLTNFAQLCG